MNSLQLGWKNQINKPLSMVLSLILFALGVGLISMLLMLNQQVQDQFSKNLAGIDLVIGAKGSPLQMILCNMYHIDAPTGNISIKEARPFMNPKHPLIKLSVPLSLGDNYEGFRIVGTIHSYVDSIFYGKVERGRLWDAPFEVVIGAEVANKLNMKINDQFHSSHGLVNDGINVHDEGSGFKVVGILARNGSVLDQLILTSTESIWAVHDDHDHDHEEESAPAAAEKHDEHEHEHEHDHEGHDHDHDHGTHEDHKHDDHAHDQTNKNVSQKTIPLMDQVDKNITSLLVRYRNKKDWRALNMPRGIDENTDLKTANPAYEINRLYAMMGVGTDALRTLGFAIVFVSGLSIFIALFNSLRERKHELALMRVMGATRGQLFFMIILEGLILAFLGYIFGIFLSHFAMEWLSGYMQNAYRYSFSGMVFLKEELYLLIGALIIGFIAAVIPAFQAYKTDISETLTES